MGVVRYLLDTNLLSAIDILPLEAPAGAHYGEIRARPEAAGLSQGASDLLITAHARSLGLLMVTHNLREFQCVPGLVVENWLGAAS